MLSLIGWLIVIIIVFMIICLSSPGGNIPEGLLLVFFLLLIANGMLYGYNNLHNYFWPVPPPPPVLSNIEQQILDVKSQQESYNKKINTDIPVLKAQMNSQAMSIKPQLKTDLSEANKVLLNNEIKEIAKTLLALDKYQIDCKDTLIQLQVAERSLVRTKSLGDRLGADQAKIIEDLNKKAADAGAKLSVNIDKIIGSGTITDAKIQEKISELLK